MAPRRSPVVETVSSIEPAQNAWNYSLFDAIFQRRARRFPLGAEMPGAYPQSVKDHMSAWHGAH